MKFKNATLMNQQVEVDGNEYVECKFDGCTMIFSGGGGTVIHGCQFNNCGWAFSGAAAETVAFMTSLYHGMGPGGRELIEATIENIRKGTKPPVVN